MLDVICKSLQIGKRCTQLKCHISIVVHDDPFYDLRQQNFPFAGLKLIIQLSYFRDDLQRGFKVISNYSAIISSLNLMI